MCHRCQSKDIACVYSESSQPSWIRRVEDSSKNDRNDLHTPALTPDESPNAQAEPVPVPSIEQPRKSHSPCLSYRQSLPEEHTESQPSPLNW